MKYIGHYPNMLDAQTECTLLTRETGLQCFWYEKYGAYHVIQNEVRRKNCWEPEKEEESCER